MIDDAELLCRYVESRSEAAFAEFVARHLKLVYFAALRRVNGNAALAEEVAQQVFTAVAREAATLMRHATVTGWLYTTTRNLAAKTVRAEEVRQRREQALGIYLMQTNAGEPAAVEWERLRPAIDESLEALHDREREAVLLRFFEGRAFAEIGGALKISEDAARMRVDRALEKLRTRLALRGVTSTSGALAGALTAQAGAMVPLGVAATVTSGALAGATVVSATGIIAGATAFMSMTKLGFGVAGIAVLAGALGLAVSERRARRAAEAAVVSASREYEVARVRLSGLEQRVQAAAPDAARTVQTDNARAGGATTAAAIAVETEAVNELVRSNAKAAGDLLMARHPEVKQAFLDWGAAV
ncbi:MAG: sigma-70 family RNA polymerase sigma factor, partial [Opitutaceae bacterium]